MIAEYLSAADVGLCPDLKTPLNDVSTMNKTMEYMAYALPSVSFDLVETRVSGGDTVIYVPSRRHRRHSPMRSKNSSTTPNVGADMGIAARARVSDILDWRPQAQRYVNVFDELTAGRPTLWTTNSATTGRFGRRVANSSTWMTTGNSVRFIQERSRPDTGEEVDPTISVA